MPLALLCLALPLTLDIVSRGETVGALLKEASKQSGIVMEAVPQTKQEIVIVSLKGVPVEEFRTRLATAIGAEWSHDGATWRLVRPLKLQKAQEAEERNYRVIGAKQGIDSLKAQVAKQPAFDANAARLLSNKAGNLFTKFKGHLSDGEGLNQSIALEPETPAGRMSIAAVGTLSAEQVADVLPGERIVYATNPTRMQRPFPADLTKILQRYVAEQALYSQALSKLSDTGAWGSSWSPLLAKGTPSMPSEVLMTTARSPYNNSLTVGVILVGPDGKYLSRVQTLLNIDSSTKPVPPVREANLPLSPLAQRFWAGLSQLMTGKTFIEDQKLLKLLDDPVVNDPLSFLAADGVLGLANGDNIIACIPDTGLSDVPFQAMDKDGTLNLKKFSDWLTANCSIQQNSGWLTARPKLLVTTRAMRVDRAMMGAFFRHARRNDGAALEDILDLVEHSPDNYMQTIIPFYAFFVLPDLNAAIDDRNIEMLRVMGRMNDEQRVSVMNGAPLEIRNMSSASHWDLNHLVFRADSPISISIKSVPGQIETEYRGSLENEITYALPDGVPEDGKFSVIVNQEEVVMADGGSTPAANYRPLTAWALGSMMVRAEKADPNDPRESFQIDRYRYGRTRRIQMSVQLSESISLQGQVNENRVPRSKPSVPYAQLPQTFRDEVEKAKAAARKQGG